ncbi:hypothetical protein F441_05911 [Phytophthora nicotianae CJ01A1]|uniref:Uncharacterized protein n=1 Tax=Phytophthora nicotianae CJ01A1 TaxID=1317063 RepID=W2XD91_PHYNI|nr:hypothetical protein F441_05911 [Phytophthora nicotianae CJ01A1]
MDDEETDVLLVVVEAFGRQKKELQEASRHYLTGCCQVFSSSLSTTQRNSQCNLECLTCTMAPEDKYKDV